MTKIPEVHYRTKEIKLGEQVVRIKGHRGGDYSLIKQLSKLEVESLKLSIQLSRITISKDEEGNIINKLDIDLTDKEIDQLIKIKEKIDELKYKTKPIIRKLAQRGVKRFYNSTLNTDEIDEIEDIELNDGEIDTIHQAMNEMDQPLAPEADGGSGKSKKK